MVLDNYSPHKHHKVRAWREAHPRFYFHFTPAYASWLNRVEHWFSTLQRQVMDRGSFDDVAALQATLGRSCGATTAKPRSRSGRPPPTPSWSGRSNPQNLRNGAL